MHAISETNYRGKIILECVACLRNLRILSPLAPMVYLQNMDHKMYTSGAKQIFGKSR